MALARRHAVAGDMPGVWRRISRTRVSMDGISLSLPAMMEMMNGCDQMAPA